MKNSKPTENESETADTQVKLNIIHSKITAESIGMALISVFGRRHCRNIIIYWTGMTGYTTIATGKWIGIAMNETSFLSLMLEKIVIVTISCLFTYCRFL